jgi:hypothetical protein
MLLPYLQTVPVLHVVAAICAAVILHTPSGMMMTPMQHAVVHNISEPTGAQNPGSVLRIRDVFFLLLVVSGASLRRKFIPDPDPESGKN